MMMHHQQMYGQVLTRVNLVRGKKETTKEEYASGMREQVMNSSSGQDFALIAACDKARKQMLSEESGKDGRRDEDIGNPDEEDKSSEEETSENIDNDTGGNVEIQDVRFTRSTTRELNLKIDRYGTVKKNDDSKPISIFYLCTIETTRCVKSYFFVIV